MNEIIYTTDKNKYEMFEKRSPSKYTRRCIDNVITSSSKCKGYCNYKGHPGFLTENHMKQHNCINKNCFYFIAKQNNKSTEPEVLKDESESILSYLQKINSSDGIKFIRIERMDFNTYTAYYITITKCFDFTAVSKEINEIYNVEINFKKLHYDFDMCVKLLFGI